MCQLCNGDHVIHEPIEQGFAFVPCPNCGPQSQEEHDREFAELYEKLDEAEAKYKRRQSA